MNVTAAPTTVELGGRTFRVKPMRDVDNGDFVKWIQDKHLALAQRNLKGMEDKHARMLLQRAYDKAAAITMESPEVLTAVQTIQGIVKLFWLLVRQEHPEVCEAELHDLLVDSAGTVDVDRFETAAAAIERVSPRPRTVKKKAVKRRPVKRSTRR